MRLKSNYRRNLDINKSASYLFFKVLIGSFVFYVDFRLNFKDVDILVFLAFARINGFQIGWPSYSTMG